MDFDDLDECMDERMASGDTAGLEGMTVEKKDLKKFEGKLPLIQTSKALVAFDFGPKEISLRAFIFYGPGDSAQNLQDIAGVWNHHGGHIQLAFHEWPGYGGRSDEAMADNVDALVADAMEAIKPSMEQVQEGAQFEGAPFAFIGSSVGCQVMTALAKRVLVTYGMTPCAAVVMNRAALEFPLLSPAGQTVLDSSPEKVVHAFKLKSLDVAGLEKGDIEKIAKGYQYTSETREPMYHKYDCDLMLIKSSTDPAIDETGKKGGDYRLTTLKIKGSNECFTLPVTSKTKVNDFLSVVGCMFANSKQTQLNVFDEDGTAIDQFDTVKNTMTIAGLEDFKHPRYTWPHPVAIIGAGFFGVKMAMQYHYQKNYNMVLFDRLKEAGGYAWTVSATKHSRVQTDFGAFNIWFGHEYNISGDGGWGAEKGGRQQFNRPFKGPGSPMGGTVASGAGTTMDANPVRHQVIGQLNYALKEYGCDKATRFETEVSSLKIIGDPEFEGRCYKLGLHDLRDAPLFEAGKGTKDNNAWTHDLGSRGTEIKEDFKASVVIHFPGAYDLNRIVNYPGEDKFGGQIGYGMGSGHGGLFVFDKDMKGKRAAVLGNGAFSIENVRSCIEGYASKIYIVTRRKSLLCPRMPCWFCHQAPTPTGAPQLLDIFKPMYDCAGIEDPWDFYAVTNTNEKRTVACLKQSSRFGIGDVTFLAHAVGLFEYRIGTVERFSHKTIHLSTGEKLENMDHVCKALGLVGDPRVDQLHAMTYRIGYFVDGDWRRIISADPTGMDAMRFTTFSAGPGACSQANQWYYMHNHPWEYREVIKDPLWATMPKHQLSITQPDQPVYMINIGYEMHHSNVFGNCWPSSYSAMGNDGTYMWCLVQTMHPTKEYFDYCKADWDRYQKLIKENCPGFEDVKEVPYPYSTDDVAAWCERYNSEQKIVDITPAGPSEQIKKDTIEHFKAITQAWKDKMIPELIKEYKLVPDTGTSEDPKQHAGTCEMYRLKKDLTATEPDSAMDFADDQYEAWKNCISTENTFSQESIGCHSDHLIYSVEAWGKILELLCSKTEVEGEDEYVLASSLQ